MRLRTLLRLPPLLFRQIFNKIRRWALVLWVSLRPLRLAHNEWLVLQSSALEPQTTDLAPLLRQTQHSASLLLASVLPTIVQMLLRHRCLASVLLRRKPLVASDNLTAPAIRSLLALIPLLLALDPPEAHSLNINFPPHHNPNPIWLRALLARSIQ